jgi:hypothetical protein
VDPASIDPSSLTTAQLQREIAALEKLATQRMDAIEQAVRVAHENLVRVPTEVDKAIGHLKEVMLGKIEVMDEKFFSVQTQFVERDVRAKQSSEDQKVAIGAALQAAKEAVGEQNKSSSLAISKSEAATTKQIEQIVTLIQSTNAGILTQISDIKDNVTRLQSEDKGERDAKTTQQTSNMSTVSIVGLILGSLIGVGGIVIGLATRS